MNPYVQKYMDVVNQKGSYVWEEHHTRYLGEMTPENIARVAHLALTDRKAINFLIWEALAKVFDAPWEIFSGYKHFRNTQSEEAFVKTCLVRLTTQKEPNLEEWL